MATAKKLPSGSWRVLLYDGKDAAGKRRFESFTAPTKKEAEFLAAEYAQKKKDRLKSPPTLGEAIDEFIETCRAQDYSPSTIKDYVSRRKNSFPTLINMRVDKIRVRDVQQEMNGRAEGHTPKTVRNDFYLLKTVLDKYAPDLRLDQVILSRRKSRTRREFAADLPVQVLNCARQHFETDFYLYCCFIISSGLRPSEIYALTWGDVSAEPLIAIGRDKSIYKFGEIRVSAATVRDENAHYITKQTKTAAGIRTIRVDWSFFENLYAVKPRGRDDERIMQLHQDNISHRWPHLREMLGLPKDMRFYDLRHYFATAYANSGATEEELQKVMGHTTATFTHQVYVELIADREASINEEMARQTAEIYGSICDDGSV